MSEESDTHKPEVISFNLPETFHSLVLLVDDQPFVSDAVRRAFMNQRDIDYHFCALPEEAVAMANQFKPTVILLDLVMPKISGLELLKQFRANPETMETPIVMLSSREEAITKSQAFTQGANDYLVKLPDTVELCARVRYHSRGHIIRLQKKAAFVALRESQRELLKKNTELYILNQHYRDAMEEVRELEGLLPVCASCQEINRDDFDKSRLKAYLSKHPDFIARKGICHCCEKEVPENES